MAPKPSEEIAKIEMNEHYRNRVQLMLFWAIREKLQQSSQNNCPFMTNMKILLYPLIIQFLNLSIPDEDDLDQDDHYEESNRQFNFKAQCYV